MIAPYRESRLAHGGRASRPGKPSRGNPAATPPDWHAAFLAMLPVIERVARRAFRRLRAEAREEFVQEAIANALVAFVRLVELGKQDLAYPTVLAHYAVRQVFEGRRVGARLNVRNVLSPYARRKKNLRVERLDRYDAEEQEWLEAVVEDDRTPVADQAAFRVDYPAWLASLSARHRRIAAALALGHTTGAVARRFRVSPARVSQLRGEFHRSWRRFHGEPVYGCSPPVNPGNPATCGRRGTEACRSRDAACGAGGRLANPAANAACRGT